jgi:hypothetical protein
MHACRRAPSRLVLLVLLAASLGLGMRSGLVGPPSRALAAPPTIAPTNTPDASGVSQCNPGNGGTPIPCPQPCSDNGVTFYPPANTSTPVPPAQPTYTPVPPNPPFWTVVVTTSPTCNVRICICVC